MTASTSSTSARLVWLSALTVGAGAAVATAHGLYRVATGAGVTPALAWLYPLITDGFALVGYAATSRLSAGGRRYPAGIVVLAAGLSGLAQAVYLTGALHHGGPPAAVRFGVGAWPAIAAALTAHLLHLITASNPEPGAAYSAAFSDVRSSVSPYNALYTKPAVQPPVMYFLVVVPFSKLLERFKPTSEEPTPVTDCPHCLSSIPIAATVCSFCTRDVAASGAAQHGTR